MAATRRRFLGLVGLAAAGCGRPGGGGPPAATDPTGLAYGQAVLVDDGGGDPMGLGVLAWLEDPALVPFEKPGGDRRASTRVEPGTPGVYLGMAGDGLHARVRVAGLGLAWIGTEDLRPAPAR